MISKHSKLLLSLKNISILRSQQQILSFSSCKSNLAFFKQKSFATKHNSKSNSNFVCLNDKIMFSVTEQKFSTSMIQSLQQYKRGAQLLQKGQYPLAIGQFQIALKFLPKIIQADQAYNSEYQALLLKRLLDAHVMMNRTVKTYKQAYGQYLHKNSNYTKFVQVLEIIESGDLASLQTIETQNKLWKQLVRAFAFKNSKQCFGKHIPIHKVHQIKDLALKYIGLYLYQKIKNRQNKERQNIYLTTCRQLLKQTQQFQPSKIVKPLSLMASNLLAGDQFLQAEGLMSHCLSALQQFHHQNPSYLKTDQEYILCKLIMSRVFQGVNRKDEFSKIQEQYGKLFDQKRFMLQQLVQISYREL